MSETGLTTGPRLLLTDDTVSETVLTTGPVPLLPATEVLLSDTGTVTSDPEDLLLLQTTPVVIAFSVANGFGK